MAHCSADMTPPNARKCARLLIECLLLQLDLDLHAGGELESHQSLDGLGGGVGDVDQALVGAALELLTAVLVLVDSAQDGDDFLLGGQRDGAGNWAPVRLAVSTIFSALWSMTWWS